MIVWGDLTGNSKGAIVKVMFCIRLFREKL